MILVGNLNSPYIYNLVVTIAGVKGQTCTAHK